MTINQLRYFLAVCQYNSYTKAAGSLYVSQPTVFQSIKDLEKEAGAKLFIKKGNSIFPTKEGRLLRDEAEKAMNQLDHIREILHNGKLDRNYLRIGFTTFSGNEACPNICSQYHKKYPNVSIISQEATAAELLDKLRKEDIDIVIASSSAVWNNIPDDVVLGSFPLCDFRLDFCVSTDSELADKKSLTPQEIAEYPVVIMDDSWRNGRGVINAFRNAGVKPNVILRTSQMYTVEKFVYYGAAGGFLPRSVIRENPMLVSIPVEGNFLGTNAQVRFFWNKTAEMYPAIQNFIDTARELYPQK